MKSRYALTLALPLMLAACAPPGPPTGENAKALRNVVAQLVQPQPLSVQIKLPVNIRPLHEIELRAATGGVLTSQPFDKGDTIPASSIPEAQWLELDEFMQQHPEAAPEDAALRNMAHLTDFNAFAQTEHAQLIEALRETQSAYDQAARDLKRAQDYPQTTAAQLDQARTRKVGARAAVNRVLAMLHDSYICAPMAGTMTARMRRQGEYVNQGELIGTMAVMETLVADLHVPEAHHNALKVGDTMSVRIGSAREDSGEFVMREAVITRIDPMAHPITHSFTVEMRIDNADLSLRAGVLGTTQLTIYSREEAMIVPLSSVRLNGRERSLFVLPVNHNGKVQELKDIKLGHLTNEWVEIKDERLVSGMRVITFGAHHLSDGDSIKFTEKDPYVAANGGRS